jgi:hypothetical protein
LTKTLSRKLTALAFKKRIVAENWRSSTKIVTTIKPFSGDDFDSFLAEACKQVAQKTGC